MSDHRDNIDFPPMPPTGRDSFTRRSEGDRFFSDDRAPSPENNRFSTALQWSLLGGGILIVAGPFLGFAWVALTEIPAIRADNKLVDLVSSLQQSKDDLMARYLLLAREKNEVEQERDDFRDKFTKAQTDAEEADSKYTDLQADYDAMRASVTGYVISIKKGTIACTIDDVTTTYDVAEYADDKSPKISANDRQTIKDGLGDGTCVAKLPVITAAKNPAAALKK